MGWRGGSVGRASDSRSKDPRFEPCLHQSKPFCPVSDWEHAGVEETHLSPRELRHRFPQLPDQRRRGQGGSDDLEQTGAEQGQRLQRDGRFHRRVHRRLQAHVNTERHGQPLWCVPRGRQALEGLTGWTPDRLLRLLPRAGSVYHGPSGDGWDDTAELHPLHGCAIEGVVQITWPTRQVPQQFPGLLSAGVIMTVSAVGGPYQVVPNWNGPAQHLQFSSSSSW